jgi:hypothetical protein
MVDVNEGANNGLHPSTGELRTSDAEESTGTLEALTGSATAETTVAVKGFGFRNQELPTDCLHCPKHRP